MDQDRPPYWLGDGERVPEPPGLGVELIRAAAAGSLRCPIKLVRLPVQRIRTALQTGEIDFAPVEERADYPPEFVLPHDKQGAIDRSRAIQTSVIVFVRASDALAADLNTPLYFQGRTLGATQGAAYAARLREAGIAVDDGARDLARNIDKLKLGRIDGVALTLATPTDMDRVLATRYGKDIARLRVPLVSNRVWLATNQTYYRAHAERTEALWNWLGNHRGALTALLDKYSRMRAGD